MKKLRKAETFGEPQEWQICQEDRLAIELKFLENSDEYITDEALDDIIVVLFKLGYLELE